VTATWFVGAFCVESRCDLPSTLEGSNIQCSGLVVADDDINLGILASASFQHLQNIHRRKQHPISFLAHPGGIHSLEFTLCVAVKHGRYLHGEVLHCANLMEHKMYSW
jgi:hypothetical protein